MFVSRVTYYFVLCYLLLILTTTNSYSIEEKQTTLRPTTFVSSNFTPYRYYRYILLFFSENVTITFFKETILKKLIEFDNYCGGENYQTTIYFGSNDIVHDYDLQCTFCSIDSIFENINIESHLNFSRANISAGAIADQDVNNLLATLINVTRDLDNFSPQPQQVAITKQVILITDYATEAIRNHSSTVLKSEYVKHIAQTTNLTNATAFEQFPKEIWSVFPSYIDWNPVSQTMNQNPICGLNKQNYTTPSPPFNGNISLNIYLFLSADYVNLTKLTGIIELLRQLTLRRWLIPCRQFRKIQFAFRLPIFGDTISDRPDLCIVDDSLENEPIHSRTPLCSPDMFTSLFKRNTWNNFPQSIACNILYEHLFDAVLGEHFLEANKFLLITDVPYDCSGPFVNEVRSWLEKYSDYMSGAPFTVIGIDKEKDQSVASSFTPLFPTTQLPNLYEVNNISQLLENINKSINFCLDSVPWLEQSKLSKSIWYFYLIGAVILTVLIVGFVILMIRRSRKRREKIRQLRDNVEMATKTIRVTHTTQNKYERGTQGTQKDPWEVSLKSLDVDYVAVIGKGAFSIVHLGYLHGKAPVLSIFPSMALQQFSDCNVAVKTVPQHSTESDRAKFRDEIGLMKEIGYNMHIVSMLGYNCSINRPILLMELAQQDLHQWLTETSASAYSVEEREPNLEKALLSISWQISDGMSYLSSKQFVHRDLAARNILLNKEMKAMISDFGLCRKLDDVEQVITILRGKLPIKWLALESLQDHKFSIKTDVWSFGVLLYEIFSLGQEPYLHIPREDLITFLLDGNRLDVPRFASKPIYDLMKRCWNADPVQRPDFFKIQSYCVGILEENVADYGYLQAAE